jgi:hypothetical protein
MKKEQGKNDRSLKLKTGHMIVKIFGDGPLKTEDAIGAMGVLISLHEQGDRARKKACAIGGKESGASRREERKERNEKIIKNARELLETRPHKDMVNILAKRTGLTSRQIRYILKEKNL